MRPLMRMRILDEPLHNGDTFDQFRKRLQKEQEETEGYEQLRRPDDQPPALPDISPEFNESRKKGTPSQIMRRQSGIRKRIWPMTSMILRVRGEDES